MYEIQEHTLAAGETKVLSRDEGVEAAAVLSGHANDQNNTPISLNAPIVIQADPVTITAISDVVLKLGVNLS